MAPAIGPIAEQPDLPDFARRADLVTLEQRTQALLKGTATAHRRVARRQEYDILFHQRQNRGYVTGRRGLVPYRHELADFAFIGFHGGLLESFQRVKSHSGHLTLST